MADQQVDGTNPEIEALVRHFTQRWIAESLDVTPLTEDDRQAVVEGIRRCYRAAGVPWPDRVVWARSPHELATLVDSPRGARRHEHWRMLRQSRPVGWWLEVIHFWVARAAYSLFELGVAGAALALVALILFRDRVAAAGLPADSVLFLVLLFGGIITVLAVTTVLHVQERLPSISGFREREWSRRGSIAPHLVDTTLQLGALSDPSGRTSTVDLVRRRRREAVDATLRTALGSLSDSLWSSIVVIFSQSWREAEERDLEGVAIPPPEGASLSERFVAWVRLCWHQLNGDLFFVTQRPRWLRWVDGLHIRRHIVRYRRSWYRPGATTPVINRLQQNMPSAQGRFSHRTTIPAVLLDYQQGMLNQGDGDPLGSNDRIRDMMEGLFAARKAWFWNPSRGLVAVCEPPREFHTEWAGDRLRLHNPDGPAIVWADAHTEYYLHGVLVPERLLRSDVTSSDLARETNSEVRRVVIERMGWAVYRRLADLRLVATAPDPGNRGRELSLYDDRSALLGSTRILVMVNGSPDRSGQQREYFEAVPNHFYDPIAAAAWQYGCPVEVYRRLARRT